MIRTAPDGARASASRRRGRRRFSLVWLIPIVAAIAGAWLVYTTFAERGPTITITFQFASGLEPGKTPIKYRDVQLGLVEPSRSATISSMYLSPRGWRRPPRKNCGRNPVLDRERPHHRRRRLRPGNAVVRRLHRHAAGPGKPARNFVALETPPVPGGRSRQAPDVATRRSWAPSPPARPSTSAASRSAACSAIISTRTARMSASSPSCARPTTRSSAGTAGSGTPAASMSLTGAGVNVRTESLQAILMGGIAFDTPVGEAPASPRTTRRSRCSPLRGDPAGSVHGQDAVPLLRRIGLGLEPGPVVLEGMVGRGHGRPSRADRSNSTIRIPVTISPSRSAGRSRENPLDAAIANQRMAKWVEYGLRGQLQSGNL